MNAQENKEYNDLRLYLAGSYMVFCDAYGEDPVLIDSFSEAIED